jgi:hypothetical protein
LIEIIWEKREIFGLVRGVLNIEVKFVSGSK